MPKADITVEIIYNVSEPEKTVIKTNAKKEALAEILERWISAQMFRGGDDSLPNRKSEYRVVIHLDLSDDTFYTESDTGNRGLTCGIVVNVFNDLLDKVTVVDLEEIQLTTA